MALIRRKPIIYLTLLVVVLLLAACERPLAERNEPEEVAETTTETTTPDESTTGNSQEEPAAPAVEEVEQPAEAVVETDQETVEETAAEEPAAEETAAEETVAEETAAEEPAAEEPAAEEPADDSPRPGEADAVESEAAEGEEDAAAEEVAEADSGDGESEATVAEAESGEEAAAAEAASEAAASEAAEETSEELPTTHTVVRGENLYQIGLNYGLSWVVIARANNLANANYIYAGQVLTIPSGEAGDDNGTDGGETTEETSYTVKAGDSLYTIGQLFGVSWVEIAEANGLVNPNHIIPGQLLKIPGSAPGPAPEFTHVVQPGETLFRISLRYGVNWMAIAQENNIESPYVIYTGQTLVIPGG